MTWLVLDANILLSAAVGRPDSPPSCCWTPPVADRSRSSPASKCSRRCAPGSPATTSSASNCPHHRANSQCFRAISEIRPALRTRLVSDRSGVRVPSPASITTCKSDRFGHQYRSPAGRPNRAARRSRARSLPRRGHGDRRCRVVPLPSVSVRKRWLRRPSGRSVPVRAVVLVRLPEDRDRGDPGPGIRRQRRTACCRCGPRCSSRT